MCPQLLAPWGVSPGGDHRWGQWLGPVSLTLGRSVVRPWPKFEAVRRWSQRPGVIPGDRWPSRENRDIPGLCYPPTQRPGLSAVGARVAWPWKCMVKVGVQARPWGMAGVTLLLAVGQIPPPHTCLLRTIPAQESHPCTLSGALRQRACGVTARDRKPERSGAGCGWMGFRSTPMCREAWAGRMFQKVP